MKTKTVIVGIRWASDETREAGVAISKGQDFRAESKQYIQCCFHTVNISAIGMK